MGIAKKRRAHLNLNFIVIYENKHYKPTSSIIPGYSSYCARVRFWHGRHSNRSCHHVLRLYFHICQSIFNTVSILRQKHNVTQPKTTVIFNVLSNKLSQSIYRQMSYMQGKTITTHSTWTLRADALRAPQLSR